MEMSTKTSGFGKYDFVGKAPIFGGISLVLVLASLIYLGIHGIRYGIDFAGGTEIQVKFEQPVTIDQLRTVVGKAQLINPQLQAFGEGSEFVVRFQTPEGANEKEVNDKQNLAVSNLRAAIDTDLKAQVPEIRRVDSVGPQVGAELKRNGLLAVFYSLLVILIYVALRFDYKYAPGAVLCLAHDAIITLAIFVLVGKEVNVPILAAILTLIGYSLNDTIVVFDRIRETEGEFKSETTKFAINRAINDMLGRTIITSGTTLTSAICLWFFGGGDVADIAFALAIGIFFGTYSSIYVAAPLMILFEKVKLVQPTGVKARA
jgi:preprotein translocase subunit SecF